MIVARASPGHGRLAPVARGQPNGAARHPAIVKPHLFSTGYDDVPYEEPELLRRYEYPDALHSSECGRSASSPPNGLRPVSWTPRKGVWRSWRWSMEGGYLRRSSRLRRSG